MMAFAARYGHTDPSVSRRMPVTELMAFVEELARLIEEEKESMKGPGDS